jgi:hypothetical protein
MNIGKVWGDLVRVRLVHWFGHGSASAWIMAGTLTLAAASAAYLNPPATHAVHGSTATRIPAPAAPVVYLAHHCDDGGFGGY